MVENAALFTGIGIANLVKIFNPEGFVIGGGMSKVGDFYLDRIQNAADSYLHGYPKARLFLAELGTDAGVIGAASIAAH
ncbi:MAG: ROK family protein [Trueperaceae bacterium]|nr:MAG: ROK family protein [Trueperaceae bacterium]